MGRCYEFGTAINPDCDHGMVVVDEGGACRCPICGTLCRGKFAGCAEIVSRPGYASPLAPPRPRGAAVAGTSVLDPPVAAPPRVAEVVTAPVVETAAPAPVSAPVPVDAPANVDAEAEAMRAELERALLEEFRAGISAVVKLDNAVTELGRQVKALQEAVDRLEQGGFWSLFRGS